MLMSAEPISAFVNRHPTVKMLALSFLLLIGMSLVAEGFDQHVPKGYIYFAMGFSVFVEMLNLRLRGRREPVHLHERYTEEAGGDGSPHSGVLWGILGGFGVLDVRTYRRFLHDSPSSARIRRGPDNGLHSGADATRPDATGRTAARRSAAGRGAAGTRPERVADRLFAHRRALQRAPHDGIDGPRDSGAGTGTVDYDGKAVESIKADVTIDVAGIDTGVQGRDNDLRSNNFFDVATFPTITFKSKRAEPAGAEKFKLIGDLTIHGVTKEVALDVDGPSPAIKQQNGALKAGASATTKIIAVTSA